MADLSEAVRGNVREALEALRDVVAKNLADAEPKEAAALARVLADLVLKLDGLSGGEESELDDLADRRTRRRAGVQDGTGKPVKRGRGGG